jgi:hypothetical protein
LRRVAWLVAAALALVAAFVVVPPLAAGGGYVTIGDNTPLATAFADNLVTSWTSPSGAMTSGMTELIDLWRRWHAIKIVISGLLTVVSGVLAFLLWSRFLRDDTGGRRRLGYAGCAMLVTVLALGAVVVVAANIQATAAPLSALIPLLPADPPPGELRDVMAQIRSGLVDSTGTYAQRPALLTLVDSQRRYLSALALTAAVLAIMFAAAGLRAGSAWRATAPDKRRRRRTALGFTVALALSTAAAALAAALTFATDPAASLLTIFTTG